MTDERDLEHRLFVRPVIGSGRLYCDEQCLLYSATPIAHPGELLAGLARAWGETARNDIFDAVIRSLDSAAFVLVDLVEDVLTYRGNVHLELDGAAVASNPAGDQVVSCRDISTVLVNAHAGLEPPADIELRAGFVVAGGFIATLSTSLPVAGRAGRRSEPTLLPSAEPAAVADATQLHDPAPAVAQASPPMPRPAEPIQPAPAQQFRAAPTPDQLERSVADVGLSEPGFRPPPPVDPSIAIDLSDTGEKWTQDVAASATAAVISSSDGRQFAVSAGALVGRFPTKQGLPNDYIAIEISDKDVSRLHLELRVDTDSAEGPTFVAQDLNSSNGTALRRDDGAVLAVPPRPGQIALDPGDVLIVADISLRFVGWEPAG